jgi:hypothetical protein
VATAPVKILSAVFPKPVKRVAEFEDAAAMRLHVLAPVIGPDFAGLDERRRGGAQKLRGHKKTKGGKHPAKVDFHILVF